MNAIHPLTRFDRQTRRYREFEKNFVSFVHTYWLDHDDQLLADAVALLDALDAEAGAQHVISSLRTVSLTGWLLSNSGFRIRGSRLRTANPDYTIHFRRHRRVEIARRDQLPLAAGFVIDARSALDSPEFRFEVTDAAGGSHFLPTSNSDAAFEASFFPRPEEAPTESGPEPHGYLDSLRQAPWPLDDDRTTWLAALAHRVPKELFDVIDSPMGSHFGEVVARVRDVFASESRWSDRFNAAGLGLAGAFHSDFHLATVDRPFDAVPAAPGEQIAVPVFVGRDGVHRAEPGGIRFERPATEWLHLDDARVQDGGTVLVDTGSATGSLVVYEESADPRRDFVAGQWETIFGSQQHPEAALVRLKEPATDVIDEGILLSGRSDSNWYHWLIEYLPRVMMIEPTLDLSVPLLITARTPASGLAALRASTDRPLVTIDPDSLQRVRRLHVVAPPVQILDTTRVPWAEGVRLNPEPLHALRVAWGLDDTPVSNGRRVFLSRKSAHRGLLNEAELVDIAVANGLEVVEPGTMTFEDQLALFSGASLVVGASGAVMANYLMMSRGSRVIALTSDALTDFILPAAIAAVAGVGFSYASGPTRRTLAESGTRNNWIHSDFSVPVDVFTRALQSAS